MGWWSLGAHGGISGVLDAPHPDEREMFMGDGPADIMDGLLDDANKLGFQPTKAALKKVLLEGDYSEIPDGGIHDLVFKAHMDLVQVWRETWERNPYPEELAGCLDFSFALSEDNEDS